MSATSRSLRRTRNRALGVAGGLAGLLTVGLVVGLATAGGAPYPRGDDRDSIDPRSYYEDYEAGGGDGWGLFGRSAPESSGDMALSAEPPPPGPSPGPTELNTFVDAGTSGVVETSRDALSTFALDVDTGSYGVARTLLRQGVRPPPSSIRVEEWVNAQAYGAPAASGDDLTVSAESATALTLDDGTQLVRVGVDAREIDAAERPRVNVTLVVDRSGSMDIAERLGLVQSSLALLAQRLDDDDTVAVVGFEDAATTLLEPTPVRDTDRILDAIDDLEPGGSTNLADGLRLGYEKARENFEPDSVNAVVLASDGVANVGATGPGSIADRIAREGRDGIHLVTVGYGMGNYNDHLMEQLADLGDGFYSYVDTYAEAERLFGTDLVTTLTPVAADARAQVAFDPARVASYRLIGYDNRQLADEDFEDLGVDAGELGAGHRATALYEVTLADGVTPGTTIGRAEVRWRSTADGAARTASSELLAADPDAEPTADLALAATVADLAQLLKDAPPFRDRGVRLADLRDRAVELDAAELVTLIDQAADARRGR